MKPTDILSSEHRVIEQVLDCLDKMIQTCQREHKFDEQSAKDAVDFFRNFADRCHHGKEEAHLFPAMEAKGFARDCGPTGVMIYEHEQGRKFVRGMAESIDAAAKGDAAEQKEFFRNAREYIDLLREHIRKEDHCLFGMANNAFTEQDQQALSAAFENVEAKEIGPGVHEKYLKIADDLAKRFGIAIAHGVKASGHACGCGH
ncbi:MAG: hemerythrin domain-containing protein [Thermoguttaceae bacterium]|jgi:hemerythrin-like domain-containing protein